jgi:O-antigen ligase
MITLSEFLFFLLFFCLFFLLLIFGETAFIFTLAAVVILMLLCFSKKLEFSVTPVTRNIFLLSVAVLVIAALSLIFTVSVPSTVNKFFFLLFGFLIFWFFLFLNKKWLENSLLGLGFTLVGTVLAAFTLLSVLFPHLLSSIPSMNLLIANYGHSHANIFYLFCVPLVWYIWKKRKYSVSIFFLICFFFLALILSFGRFAIVMSFLQLIVLFVNDRVAIMKSKSVFLKIGLLLTSISVVLFGIIVLSIFSSSQKCLSSTFQLQLCKPLREESRIGYWSQAIEAILDRPLVGWGGNTFSIISHRFKTNTSQFSAYTHNEYLQLVSEYGVIGGGVFLFFIGYLAYQVMRKSRESSSTIERYFAISFFSLLIDGLVDYNWHYIAIWIAMLTSAALLLRKDSDSSSKTIKSEQMIRKSYLLGVFIFIGWSLFYMIGTYAWMTKNYDFSLQVFPFVNWRVEEAIKKSVPISAKSYTDLMGLYSAHVNMYSQQPDDQKKNHKKEYLQHLLTWNPSDFMAQAELLKIYFQEKDSASFAQEVNRSYSRGESESLWLLKENLRKSDWYVSGIKESISNQDWQLFQSQTKSLLKLDLGYRWQVWDISSPEIFSQFKIAFAKGDITEAEKILDVWTDLLRLVEDKQMDIQVAYAWKNELINSYLLVSRDASADKRNVVRIYQKLTELEPHSLSYPGVFPQSGETDTTAIAEYIKIVLDQPPGSINIHTLNQLTAAQRALDSAVMNQDQKLAEQILQFMERAYPDDYWVAAQRGNYYLLRGEKENAMKEYQICLDRLQNQNNDCYWSSLYIKNGEKDYSARYWSASKEILSYH